MESTKSNKKALIIVSIVAFLLIVTGVGGTWFFMDQRIASQKAESDATIGSLKNQDSAKDSKDAPVSNSVTGVQTVSFKKLDEEGVKHEVLLNSKKVGDVSYKGPSHLIINKQTPEYAIITVHPDGIGGYILYRVTGDVYKVDFAAQKITSLGTFAVSDISSDNKYVLGSKYKEIVMVDLSGNQVKSFPINSKYNGGGDAVFSPDGKKIAYSAAVGDPENEKSQVFIIEVGTGKQVYESEVVTGQKAELYWWYDNEKVNAG